MTSTHIPAMRPHAGGQARVTLNGHTIYLGRWGSAEAKEKYERTVAAWLDNGRQWPITASSSATVRDVADLYRAWARGYYVKGGKATNTAANAARAVELLLLAGYSRLPATRFTPKHLMDFQRHLAAFRPPREGDGDPGPCPWNRGTINEYVRHVVNMFDHAVTEGVFGNPADHQGFVQALERVKPLRKGRSPGDGIGPPREGGKVDPAPIADVKAVQVVVTSVVRDMIEVQLLTGMRPQEITRMRAGDLGPTVNPHVMVYNVRPPDNKTDHLDIERRVYIGPKAWEIIRARLTEDGDGFVFRPKDARREFDEARKASRKFTRWPSHEHAARKKRRRQGDLVIGERYSTQSYGKAISRGCIVANVEGWSPNQLRHNAASYIAEVESIQVAQVLLGHANIATTMLYVKTEERRAIAAVLKFG